MKYIVVQWRPEKGIYTKKDIYTKAMIVVESNHPRFSNGTRFDFGFMGIASCEGYAITVLPSEETIYPCNSCDVESIWECNTCDWKQGDPIPVPGEIK